MILNRVYEDFISHTNLTDPVYKSVFQKLSGIITDINSIKWKRLIYTMGSNVYDIDFETNRVLPSYILDLFRNVFEHSFQFPTDSTTIVQLDFNNSPYEIRVEGGVVRIPGELNFLMYSNLFSFFYVNNPVNDIFDEFDSLFQVINTFKSKNTEVYSSLKKQFDNEFISTEIIENNVMKDSYIEDSFLINSLEKSRNDILQQLDGIKNEKENITTKRSNIIKGVENRDKYLNEKNILSEEHKIAYSTHVDYSERVEEFQNVIKELVESIENVNASINLTTDENEIATLEENKRYFIDKRIVFEKELMSYKKLLIDTSKLLEDTKTRLSVINNDLATIEGYSSSNIEEIDQRIYLLTKEYDSVYSKLINIDQDIKEKKESVKYSNNLKDKASSLMDVNIQMMEKKDVVDHLLKSQKPQAVILVENYLRYYYVYYVQKAVDSIQEDSTLEKEWLNTIMSRNVLETYFGVQPYTLFSTIQYNPKSVKNFINVNRG